MNIILKVLISVQSIKNSLNKSNYITLNIACIAVKPEAL